MLNGGDAAAVDPQQVFDQRGEHGAAFAEHRFGGVGPEAGGEGFPREDVHGKYRRWKSRRIAGQCGGWWLRLFVGRISNPSGRFEKPSYGASGFPPGSLPMRMIRGRPVGRAEL